MRLGPTIPLVALLLIATLAVAPPAAAAPKCTGDLLGTGSGGYLLDCGTGPVAFNAGTGFTVADGCANWRAQGPFLGFVLVGHHSCPGGEARCTGDPLGTGSGGYLLDCGTNQVALLFLDGNGVGWTVGYDCANVRSQGLLLGYWVLGDDPCPA
jgi:hypothetical protein